MWPFKRGPNKDQVALAEFRFQVDEVVGRAVRPYGLSRVPDPDPIDPEYFEDAWYRAEWRAVKLCFSIHWHDGPAMCTPELIHASSHFDTAITLSVPILDYIDLHSGGEGKRKYRDYQRKAHSTTKALLELIRDDLLRYCTGFLKGDFEEFKRLYNVRHPDWTWRT